MAPTDEAAAMEAMAEAMGDSMGEAMCSAPLLVPGSPYNVKVTLPADLDFAATVLRSREQRPHHD